LLAGWFNGFPPPGSLRMRDLIRATLILSFTLSLIVFTGFVSAHPTPVIAMSAAEAIAKHIDMLRSGRAQQKAAAAYWLGQQHSAAAAAVDPLVDMLGDASEVQPSQYPPKGLLQN